MEKAFESIFTESTVTPTGFFIVFLAALIAGIVYAWMCYFRSTSSKSFTIAVAFLPLTVAMVIMLVNGNIGAGVAIAGAFSLVRFRSAQGSAKEICIIFIAMASGLAFGMGFLAYAILFLWISGLLLMLVSRLNIWEKKSDRREKKLKITIPEDLDYNDVFEDLMQKYTKEYELVKVKSTNLGSLFQLTYRVVLKDPRQEKAFIDEIRCRNGNLEILSERIGFEKNEL